MRLSGSQTLDQRLWLRLSSSEKIVDGEFNINNLRDKIVALPVRDKKKDKVKDKEKDMKEILKERLSGVCGAR